MARDRDDEARTGQVLLEDGLIKCRSTLFGDWELAVRDLRLVGEATNENGPFLDDWMLIFASGSPGWFEASFYATIHTDFQERLGQVLGAPLQTALASSATFNSRILWPPRLEGKPVFQYVDAPPRNLWERAIWKLFGPMRNTQSFTPEVEAYLRECEAHPPIAPSVP